MQQKIIATAEQIINFVAGESMKRDIYIYLQ